ncbi:hypothetical protein ACPCHT_39025 [Nucisporomicrobium flavum]|uniref:hypothetical protein n=1 Tax=Nucisporomicrobium flavum TaxID=2785915 RepID=UPI003C2EB141
MNTQVTGTAGISARVRQWRSWCSVIAVAYNKITTSCNKITVEVEQDHQPLNKIDLGVEQDRQRSAGRLQRPGGG